MDGSFSFCRIGPRASSSNWASDGSAAAFVACSGAAGAVAGVLGPAAVGGAGCHRQRRRNLARRRHRRIVTSRIGVPRNRPQPEREKRGRASGWIGRYPASSCEDRRHAGHDRYAARPPALIERRRARQLRRRHALELQPYQPRHAHGHELTDFDADVEGQQRRGQVVVGQAHVFQRARRPGRYQPEQEREQGRPPPRGGLSRVQGFSRYQHDRGAMMASRPAANAASAAKGCTRQRETVRDRERRDRPHELAR